MLTFRYNLSCDDPVRIRDVASSTGFFDKNDININVALVQDVLKGETHANQQDYKFIILEEAGETLGYACYGKIPTTDDSYEIYWLCIHDKFRGCGLGRVLLDKLTEVIQILGGRKIYIKTEGTSQYVPTRNFYKACGFEEEAVLKEYYGNGDDCCIYSKKLSEMTAANVLAAE